MSYLNPLRLHFAGKFQAAVSTVNNNVCNFDNKKFEPQYQKRTNDNWNPEGGGEWRLIGCKVKTAYMSDGNAVCPNDPILHCLIADSDSRVAAKLVDLDPQQQFVSEIWGLQVRICDAHGKTLLCGEYEPAAFMDIWKRSSAGRDAGAGAMYQSVLSNLKWGDIGHSPFLKELQASATDGLLSIKFNVDGYKSDYNSENFTLGRIVGTIGPATAKEPRHFVLGRHFMITNPDSFGENNMAGVGEKDNMILFFDPKKQINFCVAVINEDLGKIYLDLGNALPMNTCGAPKDLGTLSLYCKTKKKIVYIGNISDYNTCDWYEKTAGVIEFPITCDKLEDISKHSLWLSNENDASITEPPSGLYVRADQYVFRLNPNDRADVKFFATRWGKGHPQARILSFLDPDQFQNRSKRCVPPRWATPTDAIEFPARVVTDENGVATLSIVAKDPGNPRCYIDGQVYGVRSVFEETLRFNSIYEFNRSEFISLLVWDTFKGNEPLTWYGDIEPIFKQYANLYPAMKQFLDMADYDSVCANRELLLLALTLDPKNPNYMPVTRDLSRTKREAILRWLALGNKPLKGTPKRTEADERECEATEANDVQLEREPTEADMEGGKTAALRNRLELQDSRW